jgi:hypothetical protein
MCKCVVGRVRFCARVRVRCVWHACAQSCHPSHRPHLPLAAQAACLAKCNGARVELHRAGTFGLAAFRDQLLECAASGEEHVVVSYSRRSFLQTGDGHFSPIGGVHEGRDLALILDTVGVW